MSKNSYTRTPESLVWWNILHQIFNCHIACNRQMFMLVVLADLQQIYRIIQRILGIL